MNEMENPAPKTPKSLLRQARKAIRRAVKAFSKRNNFLSRCIRKALKLYRVSWRAVYCRLHRVKKLQDNKIVFISHRGKQYSCNPMYICEYLLEHYPGKFDIVWAVNHPNDFRYLEEKGIRLVKKETKAHLRELMSARTLVTNVDFYAYMPKLEGQITLDTWHGGGSYKTCGFANPQNLRTARQRRHFKRLYSRVSLYCSSSQAFTRETIRFSRLFEGEVLEVGMPRNDILVNHDRPDIEKKVRDYFGLDDDVHMFLYAPTYRSEQELIGMPAMDVPRVKAALEARFGGTWVCLFRQHHLADMDAGDALPATEYPDMQELLYAADVLISDYSSSIWDISLMFKPVFLYCPDLDNYTSSRDFYMPIEQWPFVLCTSQEELEKKIAAFDEADYREKIEEHHRILGSCETGHATRSVCERIVSEVMPGLMDARPQTGEAHEV